MFSAQMFKPAGQGASSYFFLQCDLDNENGHVIRTTNGTTEQRNDAKNPVRSLVALTQGHDASCFHSESAMAVASSVARGPLIIAWA